MTSNRNNNTRVHDDFFGDCDDHDVIHGRIDNVELSMTADTDPYGELSIRDNIATERQYFAIGYHETYDACYKASLQNGFDDGYRNNYDTAVHLGHLLGQLAVTAATLNKSGSGLQHQENNNIEPERQVLLESHLVEVSRRIRSQLLSLTQADAVPLEIISKDDTRVDAHGIAVADNVPTPSILTQQHRLQGQKEFEAIADDLKSILSLNVISGNE
jgi:hypothetical protein